MVEVGIGISALALVKDGIKIVKDKKNTPPELIHVLDQLREKVLELEEERLTLLQEVMQLREQKDLSENMTWDDSQGTYWQEGKWGKEGPFCPRCWEGQRVAARMRLITSEGMPYRQCVVCNFNTD